MAANNNNNNLNVPSLRFPGFSDEWQRTTLGDISSSISSGKSGNPIDEGIYNLYGSTGIIGKTNNGDYEGEKILVARVGANAGKINYNNCQCGITDNTLIIKLKEHSTKFVYYYLIHTNLNRLVFGSGQPLITGGMLKKLGLSLPSSKECEKIVSLLILLDEHIATQRKIIEKLDSLMVGIIETHFKITTHKTKVKISQLGIPFSVGNLSKEDLSSDGEPCILYGELYTKYRFIIDNVTSRTKNTVNATRSCGNELLFPSSTTVDAISLIAPTALNVTDVLLGGDMFGIHISNEYDSNYIALILSTIYKSSLAKFGKGSTIIHLHYSDIKNFEIEVPNIVQQKKLARLINTMRHKISNEQNILECLAMQRSYMFNSLFI